MGKVEIKLLLDHGRVRTYVGGLSQEACMAGADVAAQRTKQNIVSLGRVRTGAMLNGIGVRKGRSDALIPRAYVTAAAPYTIYQEAGTKGSVAKPGKFLVFRPRGSGRLVFAKRVRGVTPGNFMRDAAMSLTPRDFIP